MDERKTPNPNRSIYKMLLFSLLIPLLAIDIWCGIKIHRLSTQRSRIKKDYSEVNSIKYSLLSVDVWRNHFQRIAEESIENFSLTEDQEKVVRERISKSLNALITEADSLLTRDNKTLKGKIRKLAVRTFFNIDDIRQKVPAFTQAIIDQVKSSNTKDQLKNIAKEKLDEFAAETYDSAFDRSNLDSLFIIYKAGDVSDFNDSASKQMAELQDKTYDYTFILLGSLLLFLFTWWLVRKKHFLHKALFVFSVAFALIILGIGLTSPMIEIDARIKSIDFSLLGAHLQFRDQVLFFKSKSILEVVSILLETGKADSMVVGILILVFSIVFPISKLISTEIYLLGNEKTKRNKLLNFFAFRSGKWSMADVTVVAIFMAYIGFKGILNSQLEDLNYKSEYISSIATNETSLQPGFILFTSFVLFGLILSEILKRIVPQSKPGL
jgi:hypothetical protein